MMARATIDGILLRYPGASAFQRWHMRGRLRLCPYDRLLPHLTGRGSVLDVGCGYGHLAWYLADAMPGLRYTGTDIDARKISLAESSLMGAQAGAPGFMLGDAASLPGLPRLFGNIVFMDVLYLMPWEAQKRMLAWAFGRLEASADSAVIVKTMDEAQGFPGFRAVAEEWLMVSVLRRTLSSGALNGARPASDYLEFASGLGFRGSTESLGTFNPSTLLRFHR